MASLASKTSLLVVPEYCLIKSDQIRIDNQIGSGAFGTVHLGEYLRQKVAIKKIHSSANKAQIEAAAKALNREVKTLTKVEHTNVIRLIGACSDPPMLLMAYAPRGTLRDILDQDNLSLDGRLSLVKGISNGMYALHSKNILHLDLKPPNVLISSENIPWITDFGLSKLISVATTAGSSNGSRGTLQYKAPELFCPDSMGGPVYKKPADVYSFSMLTWETFTGKSPFDGKLVNEISIMHLMTILGHQEPTRPTLDEIPVAVQFIIKTCWEHEREKRPEFKSICERLDEIERLETEEDVRKSVSSLNAPGSWYVFISHTQRNPEGKLLALDSHTTLKDKDKSSWLDVKMNKMSMAAMEEGVKNSSCVVAIITDSCVTSEDDPKKGGPEQNAYFNRWMCQQELRWAIKYNIPIQPVIRAEDKKKIGDFIQMAPDDLKFLGGIDWKHLDRGNRRYFDLGIDMVIEGVDDLIERQQGHQKEQRTNTIRSVVTSSKALQCASFSTNQQTMNLLLSAGAEPLPEETKTKIENMTAQKFSEYILETKQNETNKKSPLELLETHVGTLVGTGGSLL